MTGKHLGYPRIDDLVVRDGPPLLCVIAGTRHGRWHVEVTKNTAAAMEATCLLFDACIVNDLPEAAVDSAVTLGIAVLQSWCIVHVTASHEHTRAMAEAC